MVTNGVRLGFGVVNQAIDHHGHDVVAENLTDQEATSF